MAEVVKYGYISNREILTMASQPNYKSNIENITYECVKIKRDVVVIDEHDTGLRMILNFRPHHRPRGRKTGNYTDLTHGQAVAIGMVAAMMALCPAGQRGDLTAPLIDILKHIGLPTELNYDRESIFMLCCRTKRNSCNVNFILVREAGRAEINF